VGTWWVSEAFLVDAEAHGWMAPIIVCALPAGMGLFWGSAAMLYRLRRAGARRAAGVCGRASA
jgi:apolipoprotein N-acyltransferase